MNYLMMNRSDVQYATKEHCTDMAKPTQGRWKRLKKTRRCFTGVTKATRNMQAWSDDEVDSDWAESAERTPTSGEMMMISVRVVTRWLRTQATCAWSVTGHYAIVTGDS